MAVALVFAKIEYVGFFDNIAAAEQAAKRGGQNHPRVITGNTLEEIGACVEEIIKAAASRQNEGEEIEAIIFYEG